MSDEEALEAAVAEEPDDPLRRLVYADWLEEHGRPGAARAQRWLAEGNGPWHDSQQGLWTWFVYSERTLALWREWGCELRGMLPALPLLTPAGREGHNDVSGTVIRWWDFDSRTQAERSLMDAWPDREGLAASGQAGALPRSGERIPPAGEERS
jgi:uncharacterized protein (TIGR02996 family)